MTASVEQRGFQKSRRGQEGSQGPREERQKGPAEGGRTELGVRHLRGVSHQLGSEALRVSQVVELHSKKASVHFLLFWG